MIKPMFGFRAKPKKFDMPLRYYDPKKDQRRRERIRFESKRKRHRSQNLRIVLYALGLLMVIWMISIL